ncbi:serine/threonine protein kinase [Aphanomyces invadans]|uniref:Serine/threonine protein kinase n=1 Tax=Aphanomyces invadans TaxID=157072 RepID=A0A024TT06_9STRA|nr:serine/threonine protein kinase [Aphanomyces invadans]ETV96422.1 serine/threonine protein kinase [Aphanomyces invadans]|eukprot:XP_008874685.1 serine/threonine protein kinase [Aphanomyces invadans]
MARPPAKAATAEDKLFDAVANKDEDAVRDILADGAVNVNAMREVAKIQTTPLHLAVLQNYKPVISLLLAVASIDVNLPNRIHKKSTTPLIRAIQKGYCDIAHLLLALPRGTINCDATTDKGVSAATEVASYGRAAIVPALWEHLDDTSKEKCMSEALKSRQFEVVAAIIELGHDFDVLHNDSLLLESVAKHMTIPGLVRMLKRDLPFAIVGDGANPDMDFDSHVYNLSWNVFVQPGLGLMEHIRKEAVIKALLDDLENLGRDRVLEALVYAKDEHDRTALDTTEITVKEFLEKQFFFMERYEILPGPAAHVSDTAVVVLANDHGICSEVFHAHVDDKMCVDLAAFRKCNVELSQVCPSAERRHHRSPIQRKQHEALHDASAVDKWDASFAAFSKEIPGLVTEAEFKRFCDMQYGRKLKVALKLMRREEDYTKELEMRRTITRQEPSKYFLNALPSPAQTEFEAAVGSLTVNDNMRLGAFKHVLVLPAGDRSLADIHLKERPSPNHVRFLLEEIIRALQQLHIWNIVHCDLKMLNVLRVLYQVKLIDFDAATTVGHRVGSKVSSGVMPPEMFYKLENDAERDLYNLYWEHDSRLHNKLKPRSNIVMRCSRADTDRSPPYDFVEASPQIDIWSLGVIMFQLWSGEELVPTDVNQDVVAGQIETAMAWTEGDLHRHIEQHIANEDQRSLLSHVLVVDPSERWSLERILNHPYFRV